MKIHFIIHEAFEGAGYFEHWAKSNGHISSFSRVYIGDSLPDNASDLDCLIVMGGPQGPTTTIEECPHFNSVKEQALIRSAIDRNKMVLGVCLGAQLIGQALGATCEKSPHREIGYFPIQLTEDGVKDPLLSSFKAVETVGHWHNDMPGLTNSAKILATSEGCPRQIIRYAEFVYGFQCHLEFISADLPALIEESASDFAEQQHYQFVQSEDTILNTPTNHMNQLLGDFLNSLVELHSKSN